jgi:6-pyruvoyltetrahydropterin/6-carboxytetrahydropterin synthase
MKISVYRTAHFNAAHRLHNPSWNVDKNKTIFGKCNNPYYHGHNYELIVCVKGEIDPDTGYVIDMKVLSDLIEDKVCDVLDHKNLNEEVEYFKTVNPTAENICVFIYNILRDEINSAHQLSVRLYETPRNFVEYEGE